MPYQDDDAPPKKPVLTHGHLLVLQGLARREFVEMPGEYRLEGMSRQLDAGERLALCNFRANLTLLNRMGAFREGFLEELQQPLVLPDSLPGDGEDPEWEQADDGRQPGPNAPRRKP